MPHNIPVISGLVAMSTTVPVLTTQNPTSGPWWVALLISGMGAAGTAFGAVLTYLARRRRDKIDQAALLANQTAAAFERLQREIGRLDAICDRQQAEIDSKHAKIKTERELKHECARKLQQLQFEKDELMEKLKSCGVYINQLEFNLAQEKAKNHA